MPQQLRVLVLCGGQSSEHEVSIQTAMMILKNLDSKKYDPVLAVIQKNGGWCFGSDKKTIGIGDAMKRMAFLKIDCVFIAMHGAFGEDGRIQALLEWIGIPYTGSGILSSAMAMDKHITNILYATNGFSVPRYVVIDKSLKKIDARLRLPVIVKPVSGGSSVGVSIAKNRDGLKKALETSFKEDGRAMIQEYLKGRELTCGVIEGKNGKLIALSPTEIIPKTSSFFDYKAKYQPGESSEVTPPKLPKEKIKKVQTLALKAHQILNCRGMSRTDFILKGSKFYVLETNTIPGMTETSLLPQGARALGIEFPKLLDFIIDAGL